MQIITLQQPSRVVFGEGAADRFAEEFLAHGFKKLFLMTAPPIRPLIEGVVAKIEAAGAEIKIYDRITAEPALDEVVGIINHKNFYEGGCMTEKSIKELLLCGRKVKTCVVEAFAACNLPKVILVFAPANAIEDVRVIAYGGDNDVGIICCRECGFYRLVGA